MDSKSGATAAVDTHSYHISVASELYQQARFSEALELLYKIAADAEENDWVLFQIGRVLNRLQKYTEAIKHLEQSARLNNGFPWVRYELAISYSHSNDHGNLTTSLLAFTESLPDSINEHHLRFILSCCHYLYDEDRNTIAEAYNRLYNAGCSDYLTKLRLAEVTLSRGYPREAFEYLRELEEEEPLENWAKCIKANVLFELGCSSESRVILEEIVVGDPQNIHFLSQLLNLHAANLEISDCLAALERARAYIEPAQWLALSADVKMKLGMISEAVDDYNEVLKLSDTPPKEIGIGLAYLLSAEKEWHLAHHILSDLAKRYEHDNDVAICRINVAFAKHDMVEAQNVLDAIPATARSHPELTLKEMELQCQFGELDQARSTLARLGDISRLPRHFIASAMRLFAELKEWERLVELSSRVLDGSFDFEQFGDLIIRGARHGKLHASVIATVRSFDGWREIESLRKLHDAVAEESFDVSDSKEALSSYFVDYGMQTWQGRRRLYKNGLYIHDTDSSDCIYFCTNENYMIGTCVALASLGVNNPNIYRTRPIFLFIDTTAVELGKRVASLFQAAFHGDIRIVPMDKLLSERKSLRDTYGLFTAGQSLSVAAYYRIYAAQFLADSRSFRRALYLDSDIIVNEGLSHLLAVPLENQPIAARPEVDRPEVRKAIDAHGLHNHGYFNSGVLLFDLLHPKFRGCVKKAIHVAENEAHRLLFQDQCALNIGFAGLTKRLDRTFNWFINEEDDDGLISWRRATIAHFLDRPKPWDASYDRVEGDAWFAYFKIVASVIGADLAATLHRGAFMR